MGVCVTLTSFCFARTIRLDSNDLPRNQAGRVSTERIAGVHSWARAEASLPADFVRVEEYIPGIVVDLRYATADNPYHHQFYETQSCYLRQSVADRLKAAQAHASDYGYRIKIWDGYRPYSVQKELRQYVSDSRWIAQGVSNHNRGAAVDVTLVDRNGNELPMGTSFDEFGSRTPFDAPDISTEERANRILLRKIMTDAGFEPIVTEWWHFDAPDRHRYSVVNVPL